MHFLHAIHFNSRRMILEMNREICKEKYVSTEMNCRRMSVIVHLLRISYLDSSVHLMLKSFPIKDLLVSIALGWVHVVRESKCKRRFVNDKHVSGKPSKCLYTVIRLSKRKSTLTECLSVHNFGQTGCFLSRGQSLWCLFKRTKWDKEM